MSPFIATYVPARGIWSPVASHYDASYGEVSAQVTHFSIWGVFSFVGSAVKKLAKDAFESLFGSIKVTDPAPACGDSTGLISTVTPANRRPRSVHGKRPGWYGPSEGEEFPRLPY